jgi:hypothetical protein
MPSVRVFRDPCGRDRDGETYIFASARDFSSIPAIVLDRWKSRPQAGRYMQNEIIRNHYDVFDRIAEFGRKYSSRFAAGTRGTELFTAVRQVVQDMERLGISQLSASDDYHRGTFAKQLAVELVREDLRAIRDTALAITAAEGDALFSRTFLLPRSSSHTALLTRAKAMLEDAAPHVARFVEFELPADFLTRLEENIARLETADDDQNAGLSTRVGDTAGLTLLVAKGLRLRRQLVSVVRNKFKAEGPVLAEWESASRVVRVKRGRETEPAAQPEPSSGR